ncbi:MAG: TRAP transporter substrate-binding protein DctP [Rhodospirillaceae bacterium TMED8]|nr:TRAP transporter substrate-binding protein DctP [Magnetovibrio sp.]OUT52048.1 MAG: TRAP transporter substrate-binding protein DctP [Rhodospirillaceae bacterium TMED8]|tara:strand:- start:35 stop:1288 length:1254 start_codon:yes stop_codon:yes gene_type:complete
MTTSGVPKSLTEKLDGVSRRDFMRITKQFGVTSTMLGLGTLAGAVTLPRLAEAANSTYKKRFKNKAKHTIKFGADGMNARVQSIEHSGALQFTQDIEERTDGAVRIEFLGSNQICGQLNCVKKTQQGIVDMYTSSTQNAAGGAPYYNVLDYAYAFPSRASMFHFFYHPTSNKILREGMRKRHKLEFLFTHCEMRGIMLGKGWQDKPTVKSVTELAGTKNRVTGTQLGRIAMNLMKLNPVPIAWEETLDGLKQGLVDGAETWSAAAAFANMAPVMSQDVNLDFFSGTQGTAMSTNVFDKLPGEIQDAVLESAYLTQVWVQGHHEAGLIQIVGNTNPQFPDTIYAKNGVRYAALTDAAKKEAEEMCSPEFQPKAWEQWRERLNKWSGGHDTYKEIYDCARQIPKDTHVVNVEPRRWWRT